jgi:anti-sigma B factor antagonist
MVLDLKALTFIDSSGLSALSNINFECHQKKISFALACLTPQVVKIFNLTNMSQFFAIHTTIEDAVK